MFKVARGFMNVTEIEQQFDRHLEIVAQVKAELIPAIIECGQVIVEAINAGHKILIMGNGGSAADAQHFAAELVGRFLCERKALPAIALTTDTSILTAVANDYGYDEVFKRQVEALARPGDVVIGISTSGKSRNVLSAIEFAQAKGFRTIGLLGCDGGVIAGVAEFSLVIPSNETPRIQEMHQMVIHMLCGLVEKSLTANVS